MIAQKLGKIYNIANFNSCDVTFTVVSNGQFWAASSACEHGDLTEKSEGTTDLETAFAKLLREFQALHSVESPVAQ